MLSVKQGSIKYYFSSVWYDSTKEWTTEGFEDVKYITNMTVSKKKSFFSKLIIMYSGICLIDHSMCVSLSIYMYIHLDKFLAYENY